MWKLPVPDCNDVETQLRLALTRADGSYKYDYSQGQKQDLLATYTAYVAQRGRPMAALLAQALGAPFLQALYDAYGEVQDGRRLASLRSQLKIGVQKCPYCGFGEVRDLDHHLPRSKYKALSIYPTNLVPCCPVCNNKKRAIAEENPDFQFPHIYLDELPAAQFLIAEPDVSEQGIRVRFVVVKCEGMPDDLFGRLSFHVGRLDLERRYESEVVSFLTSQRTAIEEAGAAGGNALREYLLRCLESSKRDYGLNHWQTALLTGLSISDEFCADGYRYCLGLRYVGA
jgi:hypothetical protein